MKQKAGLRVGGSPAVRIWFVYRRGSSLPMSESC